MNEILDIFMVVLAVILLIIALSIAVILLLLWCKYVMIPMMVLLGLFSH